jgi:hypothetical protein
LLLHHSDSNCGASSKALQVQTTTLLPLAASAKVVGAAHPWQVAVQDHSLKSGNRLAHNPLTLKPETVVQQDLDLGLEIAGSYKDQGRVVGVEVISKA